MTRLDEVKILEAMAADTDKAYDRMALMDGADAIRRMIEPPGNYTGNCPVCSQRVTMTARYCPSCGQRLPEYRWEA